MEMRPTASNNVHTDSQKNKSKQKSAPRFASTDHPQQISFKKS